MGLLVRMTDEVESVPSAFGDECGYENLTRHGRRGDEDEAPEGDGPLATASRLLEAGFHPVAIYSAAENPEGKGKAPIGKAWGAVEPTKASLRAVYGFHPGAGVGVCLGPGKAPGGRWLIDVEGDGPGAEDAFLDLVGGEEVETMGWTSTRGRHRLFVVEDGFLDLMRAAGAVEGKGANAGTFKLDAFPGLEFRIGGTKSDGTVKQLQSVCPPTPGTDGEPRAWKGRWYVADIPEGVLRALGGRAAYEREGGAGDPSGPRVSALGNGDGASLDPYVRSAMAGELARVEGAAEGTRNDALNRAAFSIGTLVGAGAVPEPEAAGALAAAGRSAGLGEGEIRATVRSGLDAGKAVPRDLSGVGKGRAAVGLADAAIQAAPDVDARLASSPRTELGNAERLTARFGADVRYCPPWKSWLVWDGRRYALDETGAVVRLAERAVRAMLHEAATIDDADDRKAHGAWQRASESRSRIDSTIKLASTLDGVPVMHGDLDRDGWLWNCPNGTVDLRTGTLRPHDRGDLISQLCPVPFDPDAECPLWESTLNLFFGGDRDLIDYWQRLCGYFLVGVVREHILPIAYGTGANGKSTILGALMGVMGGDYAIKAPPCMLAIQRHEPHPTVLADLFRKRLVVAIETEEGQALNEALVKELTGGDDIRARRLYQDHWQFQPTHTVVLATNHRPVIKGQDKGIWRRAKMIPFAVSLPPEQWDVSMRERLVAEYPGILAWAVRGCLAWQARGLDEPDVIRQATADYQAEQDTMGAFLAAVAVQGPGCRVKAGRLYEAYKNWAESSGERPVTLRAFGEAMKERGVEAKKSGVVWYLGVGLPDGELSTPGE